MAARRPLPVPRRRPHRRAVLAAGAVGALVLVPASGAFADDVLPPEEGDTTQPLPGDVDLPAPGGEDQVGAPEAPAGDGAPAPDEAPPAPTPSAPPLSADPAQVVDDQAAVAVESYFGAGKAVNPIWVQVSADGAGPSAMAGAQVRIESDMDENPIVGVHDVLPDGTLGAPVPQGSLETLTFTLVTPPPGYMTTAQTTVVVPPCEEPDGPLDDVPGDLVAPVTDELECEVFVDFEVVPQYRTVQLRAVTSAGVPVPGVTFELHSPIAPLAGASLGGGTAAVVVPGRTLIGTSVTSAGGVATLAATVPPGADYLVVPTAVPDGYMLPPSIRLDLGAVDSVAEADVPVVMEFRLVPALAATGASPWPLTALAVGLLATGGGLVVVRRRLEPVAG